MTSRRREGSGNSLRNIEGHNVSALYYLNSATWMLSVQPKWNALNWPSEGGNWPQSVTPLYALMLTHTNND